MRVNCPVEGFGTPGGQDHVNEPSGVTIRPGTAARAARYNMESMASVQEFSCEICGIVTSNPIHWFVIQCGDSELTVLKWNSESANRTAARHFCGEGHAQVYISRWFDSICSPPKPDFTRSRTVS